MLPFFIKLLSPQLELPQFLHELLLLGLPLSHCYLFHFYSLSFVILARCRCGRDKFLGRDNAWLQSEHLLYVLT